MVAWRGPLGLGLSLLLSLSISGAYGSYSRTTNCGDLSDITAKPHIEVRFNSSRPASAFDNAKFADGMKRFLPYAMQCTESVGQGGILQGTGSVTIVQAFDAGEFDTVGLERFFAVPDVISLYELQDPVKAVTVNPPVAPSPPVPPPSPPIDEDLPLHPFVIVVIAAGVTSCMLGLCVALLQCKANNTAPSEDDVEAIRVKDGEYEAENGVPRRPDHRSSITVKETPHHPNAAMSPPRPDSVGPSHPAPGRPVTRSLEAPTLNNSVNLDSNSNSNSNLGEESKQSVSQTLNSQQLLSTYIQDGTPNKSPS